MKTTRTRARNYILKGKGELSLTSFARELKRSYTRCARGVKRTKTETKTKAKVYVEQKSGKNIWQYKRKYVTLRYQNDIKVKYFNETLKLRNGSKASYEDESKDEDKDKNNKDNNNNFLNRAKPD